MTHRIDFTEIAGNMEPVVGSATYHQFGDGPEEWIEDSSSGPIDKDYVDEVHRDLTNSDLMQLCVEVMEALRPIAQDLGFGGFKPNATANLLAVMIEHA